MNLIDQILLEKVDNRPNEWRKGQALFNYAYQMYPEETDKLRGSEYDCFYNDEKMELFLSKLNDLLRKI